MWNWLNRLLGRKNAPETVDDFETVFENGSLLTPSPETVVIDTDSVVTVVAPSVVVPHVEAGCGVTLEGFVDAAVDHAVPKKSRKRRKQRSKTATPGATTDSVRARGSSGGFEHE